VDVGSASSTSEGLPGQLEGDRQRIDAVAAVACLRTAARFVSWLHQSRAKW